MEILVRRARIEDAPILAHILVEGWKTAYSTLLSQEEMAPYLIKDRRKEQFERFLHSGELLWLGLLDGSPAGLLFASRENDEDLPGCGFIHSLYLLEDAHGKGLASHLMEEALQTLGKEGCTKAALWVFNANGRARRFYEKQGFELDGAVKTSRFPSKPLELRYVKDL